MNTCITILIIILFIGQSMAYCGTYSPERETIEELKVAEAAFRESGVRYKRQEITRIRTYWHIMHQGDEGDWTSDEIDAQMQALNIFYEPTGFQFDLVAVDRSENVSWWNLERSSDDEQDMRLRWHQGNQADLNLYSTQVWDPTQTTGWCFYPWGFQDVGMDGCVFDWRTRPGSSDPSFALLNQGHIAVHEVGHFMGLLHTFEGGCDNLDLVDDTPAEAHATRECDSPVDSCPDQPGLDSIRNHMNYGWDSCANSFTPGQIERIQQQWAMYRAPHMDIPESETSDSDTSDSSTDSHVPASSLSMDLKSVPIQQTTQLANPIALSTLPASTSEDSSSPSLQTSTTLAKIKTTISRTSKSSTVRTSRFSTSASPSIVESGLAQPNVRTRYQDEDSSATSLTISLVFVIGLLTV